MGIGQSNVKLIGRDLGSGGYKFHFGVLAKDGKIYCPPCSAAKVLRIDPEGGSVELIGPDLGSGGYKFVTGVLAKDGKIYCPPCSAAKVLRIDPEGGSVELLGPDLGSRSYKFHFGGLAKDGKIYCPPHGAAKVLRIDPEGGSAELIGPDLGSGGYKFFAGVLAKDGKIYCPPCNAAKVLRIDPEGGRAELIGPDLGSGGYKFVTGVFAKDGKIYCPPCSAAKVLRIDPEGGSAELIGPHLGSGGYKFFAGVLAKDDKIYCPPHDAAKVLVLGPYFSNDCNGSLVFSSTIFYQHYSRNCAIERPSQFWFAVDDFLQAFYCRVAHKSPADAKQKASEYVSRLETSVNSTSDGIGSHVLRDLLTKASWACARCWTLAEKDPVCDKEFCGLLNAAIRTDDSDLVRGSLLKLVATLNSFCVADRGPHGSIPAAPVPWPRSDNPTLGQHAWTLYRGARLPDEHVSWYEEHIGQEHRVNMFLATSCSRSKAFDFLMNFAYGPPGSHRVLYVFHLDPVLKCVNVNCLEPITDCGGEVEFLFPPYAAFRTQSVQAEVSYLKIDLDVCPDSRDVGLDVPTAPWA